MLSKRRPPRPLRLLAAWLCAVLACAPVRGAESVPEYAMKAAYVYNFAVFTEWPQDALPAGTPLAVCANRDSPMFVTLSQLNDKVVNGHRLSVRASAAPLRACHVLVLDRADRERWQDMRRELAGARVLTVSDDERISDEGAIIGLALDNRRILFDIDVGAARAAQLTLSSKLLRLARSTR
jgi:hypothetical protein